MVLRSNEPAARSADIDTPAATPTALVGGAALLVAGVLLVSDVRDASHALWRDPISFFGSPEAPYPVAFNATLALFGLVVALATWLARTRLPAATRWGGAGVGVLLCALSVFPIDCSPVDDLCEAFVRGRVHSVSHRIHAGIAATLFVVATGLTIEATIAIQRSERARRATLAARCGVLIVVVGVASIVARPFGAGAAIAEIAALGTAAWISAWRIRLL